MAESSVTTSSRLRSGLGREETRASLALFNWTLGFRSVFESITPVTGFIFVSFALSLGVAREKTGYFSTIANLACLLQIAGLWVVNYIRNRKGFVLAFGYLESLLLISAVLLTLLAPGHLRFFVLAILVLLASGSLHLTRPSTDEWLATAIPEGIRGRFLGRRMQISSIVMITSTLAVGYLAEKINPSNSLGFALILVCGGVFGIAAVTMLRGVSMPPSSAQTRMHWSDVPQMLRHRPFMRFLIGNTIYELPFALGCPFYQVFHLTVLHLSKETISFLLVGYYLLKIFLSPFFGRWVDRLGARTMIYLATPLYVLFFLMYTFCTPERYWMIFIGWTAVGIADGIFNVAILSALYASVPETSARQAYFAAYNLSITPFLAIGSAVGVFLLQSLKYVRIPIGPIILDQFHLLYAIVAVSTAICALSTFLLPGKVSRSSKVNEPAPTS